MMASILTIGFLGLLGILTLVLVIRSVFALIFGLYILFNLVSDGLLSVRYRLVSLRRQKPRRPKPIVVPDQDDATVESPSPNWALVAQCMIWGKCVSRQVEK